MKKVVASKNTDRYLVQWFKYENGSEFDDTEFYSEYASSLKSAIQMLDDISDSAEYGGIYWAGGLVDDELLNKTVYEITSDYNVYDYRK